MCLQAKHLLVQISDPSLRYQLMGCLGLTGARSPGKVLKWGKNGYERRDPEWTVIVPRHLEGLFSELSEDALLPIARNATVRDAGAQIELSSRYSALLQGEDHDDGD